MPDNLPLASGGPPLTGTLRQAPEDFQVDELLGFDLDGAGQHLFLHIEKIRLNTEQVAKELARLAGIPIRDLGYAGLKDRHAVARQWFSIDLAGGAEPDWSSLNPEQIRVLETRRHGRKLRRGALLGNRFRIRVREVSGDRDRAEQELRALDRRGAPNYFGPQRFGLGQENLIQAERLFRGELPRLSPHWRGLYLSAARSQIFNEVLARRVEQGTWDQALPGDLLQLDGSHSWFRCAAPDPDIERRLAEQDLHPTGPLWGRGEPPSDGEVQSLELAVGACFPQWCAGLAQFRMDQERRSLRLHATHLDWTWLPDGDLELSFDLPAGTFATTLLGEILVSAPLAIDPE